MDSRIPYSIRQLKAMLPRKRKKDRADADCIGQDCGQMVIDGQKIVAHCREVSDCIEGICKKVMKCEDKND